MSNDSNSRSWFKWTIGVAIAFIGAGGGLVALLQYMDARQAERQRQYQEQLKVWREFSPQSISHGIHEVEILGGRYIDLDKGQVSMGRIPGAWDLQFNIDLSSYEGFRANDNVTWFPFGIVDFASVGYREIRDSEYLEPRHLFPHPRRKDEKYLYLSHITSAPLPGYAFSLKTSAKNVALVQIKEYKQHPSGPRNVVLRYEVFPIVADPPRPRRP
ncbi:hypothetical protein [Fodinibius sediminis]|uniref:Uncharacterized protein n=1 Tax=Fodinibius sediminis TaxID=1214077 RepID=A0A521DXZ9_9BACT|nr:hypothetical protein [Fodinibius sediminis]SMO76492.1 hypothetical protein SAMN06265218_11249 [Fodinibius sediminis]